MKILNYYYIYRVDLHTLSGIAKFVAEHKWALLHGKHGASTKTPKERYGIEPVEQLIQ